MRAFAVLAIAVALSISATKSSWADKLDDIIASGKLRCAVVLDFPPMGSRDKDNKPIGFDVDYCGDLAKALGVEPSIVETPFPDRIPALISGRADVGVASTSDTLERAKSIGFSIPYFAFTFVVLTREGLGIDKYESMKGKKLGSVAGVYEAIRLEKSLKEEWGGDGSFRTFQSQADVFLALAQGQIDATVVTSTVAVETVKGGKFKGLKIGGPAPYVVDHVGLIALRQEQGLLNYLNLFVNQQVRTGRYKELFDKWVGTGEPPDLTIPGVYR
ncbi:MAG: transporter substrate-binding domain-containing protein [Hyphomicrobiaceae bacterium]|nr:transporter substrate-binding domain-containing protein [Hyphomicrobiaceae bacterium]